MVAHQLAVVRQQQHEDQHERQHDAVDHLREHGDVHEREPRHEQHAGAQDDEDGVEPVEDWRLVELLVEA